MSLKLDQYLVIAIFALASIYIENGNYHAAVQHLELCLKVMSPWSDHLDYSALGVPFLLGREDVKFNIKTIHKLLRYRTLQYPEQSIPTPRHVHFRLPNWLDKRMIFPLLPKIMPVTVELDEPAFIGLYEGEVHLSGFEPSIIRDVTHILLHWRLDFIIRQIRQSCKVICATKRRTTLKRMKRNHNSLMPRHSPCRLTIQSFSPRLNAQTFPTGINKQISH